MDSLATETIHKAQLLRELLPPYEDHTPFLSRHPHSLTSYRKHTWSPQNSTYTRKTLYLIHPHTWRCL